MPFGQVVVGPPGSGKTTYCRGLQQFLAASGRKVAIVNLDPANDMLPYEAAVDVADLVCLEEVMAELKLGPNGGLLYCMDYLAKNLDWLQERLEPLAKDDYYFLLDCPGQVELFAVDGTSYPAPSPPGGDSAAGSRQPPHDEDLTSGAASRLGRDAAGTSSGSGGGGSLRAVLRALAEAWGYRLVAVQLVDAHLCTDPSKYLSALLLSLNTMLHLELPHINVLSKMDLVRQYGKLDFNLEYYTEVQDLGFLVAAMGGKPFSNRFRKLSLGLCEVVEEYGLVSFMPLAIQEKETLRKLVLAADKANGYCFATLRGHTPYPPEILYGSAGHGLAEKDIWLSMQERYLDGDVSERLAAGEGGTTAAVQEGGTASAGV
ncbi:hypothetical protein HYH03_017817 [Edaphochlamys debaryana]|uniref:GPN-loop GTPase 2 n=1 Tax=Edaphochlamys debaryana TaxID=47281 RepID=A0A835XGJ5_9CHLO|nr:hypothetical protein HYH03_017817 [Edaphochlamys debaryana]|eukprot:KAG2483316.1 hypothetical protein HYH03_017817 [Edaphochlamys debaryana]